MSKRRLFLGLGSLAIVAAIGYAVLWLTAPPRLRVENLEKVKVGMTRAEVETLLGGPPGDYGAGEIVIFTASRLWETADQAIWYGQDKSITVCFDRSGRVGITYVDHVYRFASASLVEKIRRWLKLS